MLVKKDEIIFSLVIIWNEMVDLEELGFIEKMYSFFGCVFFEKGYWFYVDYFLVL